MAALPPANASDALIAQIRAYEKEKAKRQILFTDAELRPRAIADASALPFIENSVNRILQEQTAQNPEPFIIIQNQNGKFEIRYRNGITVVMRHALQAISNSEGVLTGYKIDDGNTYQSLDQLFDSMQTLLTTREQAIAEIQAASALITNNADGNALHRDYFVDCLRADAEDALRLQVADPHFIIRRGTNPGELIISSRIADLIYHTKLSISRDAAGQIIYKADDKEYRAASLSAMFARLQGTFESFADYVNPAITAIGAYVRSQGQTYFINGFRQDAEDFLRPTEEDSYFVIRRGSDPRELVISYKFLGEIKHAKFEFQSNANKITYKLEGDAPCEVATVSEMVDNINSRLQQLKLTKIFLDDLTAVVGHYNRDVVKEPQNALGTLTHYYDDIDPRDHFAFIGNPLKIGEQCKYLIRQSPTNSQLEMQTDELLPNGKYKTYPVILSYNAGKFIFSIPELFGENVKLNCQQLDTAMLGYFATRETIARAAEVTRQASSSSKYGLPETDGAQLRQSSALVFSAVGAPAAAAHSVQVLEAIENSEIDAAFRDLQTSGTIITYQNKPNQVYFQPIAPKTSQDIVAQLQKIYSEVVEAQFVSQEAELGDKYVRCAKSGAVEISLSVLDRMVQHKFAIPDALQKYIATIPDDQMRQYPHLAKLLNPALASDPARPPALG